MTYLPVYVSPETEALTLRAYQAVLAQWTATYTELDVPTSYGDTHVIASGSEGAPPVVLLHALFATATSWYANVGELSRYYRTYAVDVLGEANKSRPARPIISLEEYAGWFRELLDGLGIRRAYLVGNSNGAFLSAGFAMLLPERIRRLVLIGPAATIHSMWPFYIHMFLPKLLIMFFPRMPGGTRLIQNGITWMRAGLPLDPVWERLFYLTMVNGSMTSRVMPRVYKPEETARITVPTLLLIGDREKIYKPAQAIRAAGIAIPNLKSEIIPDAHHITALAQPGIVNQKLLEFFGEDESEGPTPPKGDTLVIGSEEGKYEKVP